MTHRESIHLGVGLMFGLVAGACVAAAVVAQGAPATADARHMVKLNGYDVPIYGHFDESNELVWRRADQDWANGPPILECPRVLRAAKSRYTIGVNGAMAAVTGWVDGAGRFRWCFDDQRWESRPPKPRPSDLSPPASEPRIGPGFIGTDGAINYGVNRDAVVADDAKIRASDPEIEAEVRAQLDDGKPELPKPPGVPDSMIMRLWLWAHGLSLAEVAARAFLAFALLTAVVLFVRHRNRSEL